MTALYERERELAALERLLSVAREAEGEALHLRASPGLGKSALIAAGIALARRAGFSVASARASELESEWPFGVARQIAEALLAREEQRSAVLAGAGSLSAPLLSGEMPPATPDPSFALMHGLYWACVNASESAPLLLAVDDVHWADGASGVWLGFLGRRLAGHRIAVLTAARPEPSTNPTSDPSIGPETPVLELQPLGTASVAAMAKEHFGSPPEDQFTEACHRATGGNPFFVNELLAALHVENVSPDRASAGRVTGLAPRAVSNTILLRIARLGGSAVELARALAVLGDETTLVDVAALTGLSLDDAAAAADAMVRADLVREQPGLSFAHPIVRSAVYEEISPFARSLSHARAADILRTAGRSTERVVAQLLRTEPVGAPWAVEALGVAAASAAARGAPEVAAQLLERAAAEPADPRRRCGLLLELGRVKTTMRRADALADFREAYELAPDATTRAKAAVALATALLFSNQAREAAEFAHDVVAQLGPDQREEAMRLDLLALVSTPGPVALNRWGEEVLEGRTAVTKTILGQLVFRRAVAGDPSSEVVPLARRALENGKLPLGPESDPLFAPAHVLVFADLFDEAATLLDELMSQARSRGSLLWFTGASAIRCRVHHRAGALAEAEADARQALDTAHAGLSFWELEASHMLSLVLAEIGGTEEAEGVVKRAAAGVGAAAPAYQHGFLSFAQGIVAAAAGRNEEAARAFLACGERMLELDSPNPAVLDWRSRAALALLRFGDRPQATRLAAEELAEARRFGAARAIGISLRVNALVQDPVSLEQLEEAVAVLGPSPARLEYARALVDHGAAIRRAGHRAAAREPLLEGQDLAARCGAGPLLSQAHAELLAAGARPRRVLRRGADALTASERRVATMASQSLSNPEIAQALFITTRTVEAHLSRAYRKLGITSRRDLARTLAPDEPT